MRPCVVVIIVLAVMVAQIQSQIIFQRAIRFCYMHMDRNSSPAVIATNSQTKDYESMTLCFRMNVIEWYSHIIVAKTANFKLIFDSFSHFYGRLVAFGSKFEFSLYDVFSVSPSSWNAICLSFNGSAHLWKLIINDHEVMLRQTVGEAERVDLSKIALGVSGFTGHITDVNAWGKALTNDEMTAFTFGSMSQTDDSSPDVISWNSANVTFSSSCPRMVILDGNKIASNNAALAPFEVFPFSFVSSASEAQGKCDRLNGVIYYPNDPNDLKWLTRRIEFGPRSGCPGKIWVPFKKAANKWMFDDQWNADQEADMGSWPLNTSLSEGDCMYFDVFQEVYYSSDCDRDLSYLCVLCELEKERLIYRLRSPCESNWRNNNTDNYFVLVPKSGTGLVKNTA